MAEPSSSGASQPARAPLSDATSRINNGSLSHIQQNIKHKSYRAPEVIAALGPGPVAHIEQVNAVRRVNGAVPESYQTTVASSAIPSRVVKTSQGIVTHHQYTTDQKRLSHVSEESTFTARSKEGYKTHVGPWQLGKTLGKGSSARVRLCRHRLTQQLAAVKIVSKSSTNLVQAGSLAALDKWDASLPERINGEMRVPMAIEREVAILKLIQHPNIMKLYDIWENRREIYLVLEYVDNGDLFEYITRNGRLSEEGAMIFFRQIMSAISYCHEFNICHRDLKPENILLTSDGTVKVADFGMAALHQTTSHRLHTACGSPHYAAPELLKAKQYRGDRADMWSMGVILYAMLAARLPFDDPDLRVMLAKTKKGEYEMPEFLSLEAKDLIRRILQVNPDRRITMREMWRHPLVHKYEYIDNFDSADGQPPDLRTDFKDAPLKPNEIDMQIVRQLRSLWHMFSEQELREILVSEEPNDQQIFYWLLQGYREKQLENFNPELAHSRSDYHHLKPSVWKKRISTCEFTQPARLGHGRSISRFTVISHVAETEAGTVNSYDPYKSSQVLQPRNSQVSHAKITVHRSHSHDTKEGTKSLQTGRHQTGVARPSSSSRGGHAGSQRTTTTTIGRPNTPRNTMASLHSSRQGQYNRPAMPHHKRGVDFSHVRRRSLDHHRRRREAALGGPISIAGDASTYPQEPDGRSQPRALNISKGKERQKVLKVVKPKDPAILFNEELRQFSSSIARDCDEAFGSSLIADASDAQLPQQDARRKRDSTPLSLTIGTPSTLPPGPSTPSAWKERPLPPLPSPKSQESPIIRVSNDKGVGTKPGQAGRVGKLVSQVSRLGLSAILPKQERRVVTAPAHGQSALDATPATSINRTVRDVPPRDHRIPDKQRVVSAPPGVRGNETHIKERSGPEYLSRVEKTIRVVDSPSRPMASDIPRPLKVRGVSLEGDPTYYGWPTNPGYGGPATTSRLSEAEAGKKKKSWFRRSSKDVTTEHPAPWNVASSRHSYDASYALGAVGNPAGSETTSTIGPPAAAKKKNFGFLFWKTAKSEPKMTLAGPEHEDSPSPDAQRASIREEAHGRVSRTGWHESLSGLRHIEVHQNWLARLFRVKPAKRYLCFTLSRKRARQEITILLKEWRKYGMRDIQVDKERNIVFARVGMRNYLEIKEVAFAAEIMTVIEHGTRNQLCIVRLTQERGAASSFHKVIDTMQLVFESRNLLVMDRRKTKMMVKTLNS